MSDISAYVRGVIRHRERARQIVDFSSLRFGNITPTDVDCVIEYRQRCYLLVELKHVSNPFLPDGQRLAFERLANDCKKPFLVAMATHETAPQMDIDAAIALVRRYYWRKEWRDPPVDLTVKKLAVSYFRKHGR